MAEDFPHYRLEDDDTPDEYGAERRPSPAVPERPVVPPNQEGTIFSRGVAPNVPRPPLFDFIRNQERQPEPRTEAPAEAPPSVSVPDMPETRTYQPPVEAAEAQALQEFGVESAPDDDDEDDEEEKPAARLPAATPQSQQPAIPAAHERFEDIMRAEMDEDFSRLTSGDQLGVAEGAPALPGEPEPQPRHFVPEWPAPVIPEMPAAPPGEAAFYYTEDAADDRAGAPSGPIGRGGGAPRTSTPTHSRNGGGGGGGGGQNGPGFGFGTMPPGGGSGMNVAPGMAPAAVTNPWEAPAVRPERVHKGRWFVAGFITGWVVKQHLANKKLRAQQAAHEQAIASQSEHIGNLEYNQYHTQAQLKRTEGQLQQVQAEQAQAGAAAVTMESARLNQEQHERWQRQAAGTAGELPLAPPLETPLQHASVVEAPFAGPLSRAPAAQERPSATAAFSAEAQKARPRAERPPQTPEEAAQAAVEQAYNLQQGQHIEHATGGGHNIIVDKHGHEVQNAMAYGEEFHAQRRQEQLKADLFATDDQHQPRRPAAQGYATNGIITGLASGQMDADHGLPSGQLPPPGRQRLMPGRKNNPFVASVTSPWLWAALIVLLLAFFVAALI